MVEQSDRNPREQNKDGGANKPRQPEAEEDRAQRSDEQEGRDEAPKGRPGGEKSPWLGGG